MFGEGAFNSAFVPIFAKKVEGEGKEAARVFAEEAMAGLLFILLILTIVAEIAMPFLMYGLAPGFDVDAREVRSRRAADAHHHAVFAVHVAGRADVGRVELGRPVRRKFVGLDRAQFDDDGGDAGRAVARPQGRAERRHRSGAGAFASRAFCSCSLLMWGMKRAGLTLRLRWPKWTDDLRRLWKLGIPGIISGGVTQINIAIGTMIATLQPGAVSQLYYADRLYELPLAIVGIAVGVVLLPDVARQLRAGNMAGVMDSQNRRLEFAMLLTIPAAVALALMPTEIIRVLFERGAFKPSDTAATAAVLSIFALGLAGVRADQSVLASLLRARRYQDADALCGHQLDRQYARIDRAVLPVPQLGVDAASGHRGCDHARRLAERDPAVARRCSARGDFVVDARLKRNLPLIALASIAMGVALYAAAQWLAPYLQSGSGFATQGDGASAADIGSAWPSMRSRSLATGVMTRAQLGRFTRRRG